MKSSVSTDLWLGVARVKAHTTAKEKAQMTHQNKQIVVANSVDGAAFAEQVPKERTRSACKYTRRLMTRHGQTSTAM